MSRRGDRTVYSTGPDGAASRRTRPCPRCGREPCGCEPESKPPDRQSPRVRRERAGRKGKVVTVVEPVELARDDARSLLAELRKRLGSGGALKRARSRDGRPCFALELQGDHADDVTALLCERGFRAKRAGG